MESLVCCWLLFWLIRSRAPCHHHPGCNLAVSSTSKFGYYAVLFTLTHSCHVVLQATTEQSMFVGLFLCVSLLYFLFQFTDLSLCQTVSVIPAPSSYEKYFISLQYNPCESFYLFIQWLILILLCSIVKIFFAIYLVVWWGLRLVKYHSPTDILVSVAVCLMGTLLLLTQM